MAGPAQMDLNAPAGSFENGHCRECRRTPDGFVASMKRLSAFLIVSLLCVLSAPPASAQKRKADVQTPLGKFPLEISSEYLGMAGEKTVVRIRLASPELSKGLAARGVRAFSGCHCTPRTGHAPRISIASM